MEKSLPLDVGNNKQLEVKEAKNEKQDTQLKENIENNEKKIKELEEKKREIEKRMKEEKEKMEKERERIEREREIRIKEEKEKMEREIEKEKERAERERREKEIRESGCKGCEWYFTNRNNRNKYFPRTLYNGCSFVDGLKSIGVDYSFAYRTQIAAKNGINVYDGNPCQNLHMLHLLERGELLRP